MYTNVHVQIERILIIHLQATSHMETGNRIKPQKANGDDKRQTLSKFLSLSLSLLLAALHL